MKDYKLGIIIFASLAILISLFPPFEWELQPTIKESSSSSRSRSSSSSLSSITIGKTYEFIFKINDKTAYLDANNVQAAVSRHLLHSEIVIEYLLAVLIALLIQTIFMKKWKIIDE